MATCELPQHVIHHILSLVPGGISTKELSILGLVSKGWLHACCSYEIIDLCQTCSYEKSNDFFTFADNVMTRYQHKDTPCIQKLRLHLDLQVPVCYSSALIDNHLYATTVLLNRWINIALDKYVKDLDLRFKVSHNHRHREYTIPTRVMSSGLLKSLSLGHQVCLPPIDNINCLDSLRSLEIFQVPTINNDAVFQRLIKACPAVEKLSIDSKYLDEINISRLRHLKMIAINRYPDVEHVISYNYGQHPIINFKVKIEAPTLETLCLSGLVPLIRSSISMRSYYTASVHVDRCNLKYLKLARGMGITKEEQCHGFFSSFPKLESLELHDCSLTKLILDNHIMLQKVELKFSHLFDTSIERVHMSCHNDTYFSYEAISPKKFPVILVDNYNCPGRVQVALKGSSEMHIFPYWFRKIREMMCSIKSIHNHTSLSCKFAWKKERFEANEMTPTQHLPACKIDKLNLAIAAPSQSYRVILNRFFSTLHPTTLQVSLTDDKSHDFLKFVCEALDNKGNEESCLICSSHMIKCWRHHQLKEVKIEYIKGPSGNIHTDDWGMMLKHLSTLTVDHYICFRLEWEA